MVYKKYIEVSLDGFVQIKHVYQLFLLIVFENATGLFQYHLKTLENQRFPDVFTGYRKRPVAWNIEDHGNYKNWYPL